MLRCTQSAAGGTSQRLNPGPATVRCLSNRLTGRWSACGSMRAQSAESRVFLHFRGRRPALLGQLRLAKPLPMSKAGDPLVALALSHDATAEAARPQPHTQRISASKPKVRRDPMVRRTRKHATRNPTPRASAMPAGKASIQYAVGSPVAVNP